MLRILAFLLLVGCLTLPVHAAVRSNKIVLQPGDVVYARFEQSGRKIELADVTKEEDDKAQVIFTLTREADTLDLKLKVENRFPRDFIYSALLKSKRLKREFRSEVMPVVSGKLAYEAFSPLVDEVILSRFKLEW